MAGRGVLVSSNNADSSARFDDVAAPCRSIYLPIVRGYLPEFLLALDMADPDLLVGKRPTTNVPSQALVLINSEEIHQWATQTSERILAESMSLGSRLEKTSRMLLQRYPRPYEMKLAEDYFSGRGRMMWRHGPNTFRQFMHRRRSGLSINRCARDRIQTF